MPTTSKIVLITGATAGIGRMTALHLAREGHHVIATGRRPAELTRLASEAEGLRLETLKLDVTSPSSIADAVAAVDLLTDGKGLDVLVRSRPVAYRSAVLKGVAGLPPWARALHDSWKRQGISGFSFGLVTFRRTPTGRRPRYVARRLTRCEARPARL